jgi:hypothetical protein
MNLYELVRTPGDFPRRPATSSELCQRSQGWADLDKLRLKTLTRLMNLMSLRSLGSAQFLYKGLPHVATAEAPGPDCKETWASRYAPHNWVGPTWMINEEPWMKNLQKSFVLEGAMLPLDSLRLGGNSTVCFLQLFVIVSIFPVTTCNFYIFSIVSFQHAAVSLSLLCWEVLLATSFQLRLCRTQLGNTSTHRKHQVEQLTPKLREYIAARFSEVLRLDLLDPCVTTFAYICNSFAYISYHVIPG